MKKTLFIALTLVGLSTLVSCEEWGGDLMVDWTPVNIWVEVQDKDGNDLLDPENPNNVIVNTSITYQGATYKADSTEYMRTDRTLYEDTRSIMPHFKGFYLTKKEWELYNGSKGFVLCLGEIDGAADMDEDLIITWPDGSANVIHYHCSDHKEGKTPKCNRWYKKDGVKQETNQFVFTK